MKAIHSYLKSQEDIQSIMDGLLAGIKEQMVAGLSGSARSLLLSTIYQSMNRPLLIVTHQLAQAQQLYDDLAELTNDEGVYLYPVNELIASEMAVASPELRAQRIEALTAWTRKDKGILIAPVAALKRMLPPKSYWNKYQLLFQVGKDIEMEVYLRSLVEMGYESTSMVTAPGEFSQRGGLLISIQSRKSIRFVLNCLTRRLTLSAFFDAESQRSLDKVEEVTINPATELLIDRQEMLKVAERLEDALSDTLKKSQKTC